mgnify:CR=1 FL=1
MDIETIPQEILDGLRRVEASKKIFANPRGAQPICMNKVGTMFCQRCGRNMKKRSSGPCKHFPRSVRWSMVCENGDVT